MPTTIPILLSEDMRVASSTENALEAICPGICDTQERIGTLYVAAIDAFSRAASDRDDDEAVRPLMNALSIDDPKELRRLLREGAPPRPELASEFANARAAFERILSRRARGLLLLAIHRGHLYAATDLLRCRVTTSLAQYRLQIEAAYLISAMSQDAGLALRWFTIRTDKEGRKFANDHARGLKLFRKHEPFDFIWNLASGMAHHARFGSIWAGLSESSHREGDLLKNQFQLAFHELQDRPRDLVRLALLGIRNQERLYATIIETLPEIRGEPTLVSGAQWFRECLKTLLQHFDLAEGSGSDPKA